MWISTKRILFFLPGPAPFCLPDQVPLHWAALFAPADPEDHPCLFYGMTNNLLEIANGNFSHAMMLKEALLLLQSA